MFIPFPMAAARSGARGAAAGAVRACGAGGEERAPADWEDRAPADQRRDPRPPCRSNRSAPACPPPLDFPAARQRRRRPCGKGFATFPPPHRPPVSWAPVTPVPRTCEHDSLEAGPGQSDLSNGGGGGRIQGQDSWGLVASGITAPRRQARGPGLLGGPGQGARAPQPQPPCAFRVWAGPVGTQARPYPVGRVTEAPLGSRSPKLPQAFPRGDRGPVTSSHRPALTAWVNQVLIRALVLAAPLSGFSECAGFRPGGGIPTALPHPRRPRRLTRWRKVGSVTHLWDDLTSRPQRSRCPDLRPHTVTLDS